MINKIFFGKAAVGYNVGEDVYNYVLASDKSPIEVTLSGFGARIINIRVRLADGETRDVVRGFDTLASYENAAGYLGAVVGRIGNRICRGKFTLDGRNYTLFCNNGENHLHGGKDGFDKKVWKAVCADGDEPSVTFSSVSPDGEEGYPGTLLTAVKYTLTADGGLKLDYTAMTDAPTITNLTNHVYFNLAGEGYVGQHIISLDADRYLPTDEGLIPTGELRPVDGTPFDFRIPKPMAEGIESNHPDIVTGKGIDHCFVFADENRGFCERIKVKSPDGKIGLTVFTDRPGVQFYTGNCLGDPEFPFRGGKPQEARHAFCLETQGMPDAINHPGFTDTVLRPGCVYKSSTEYRFKVN